MRKLILLVLIGAIAYFAYTRYLANPALSGSLQFPARVAWRGTSHNPSNAGKPAYDMVEVVAADKTKWRTEAISTTNRRVFVAVFDGQRLVCSSPLPTAEQADPTKAIRELFTALPRAKYEGSDSLDGRPAWRFRGAILGGATGTAWIDKETRFVARVIATMSDGTTFDERYSLLPLDLERDAARIFDTRSPTSIFTNYLRYP